MKPSILLVNPKRAEDYVEAITRAAEGDEYRVVPGKGTSLTESERTLLRYVARGWSNKAIAARRNLQEKTVMNSLTSIYDKLHVGGRSEALLYYWGIAECCTCFS